MNRFLSLLAGMMLFCIFSPLVSAQGGYEVKGFKVTGDTNWDNGNWGVDTAPEAEAPSVELSGGGNVTGYAKKFYRFSFNTSTRMLTYDLSFDQIGVIGDFNGWGTDVVMDFDTATQVFYADVEFPAEGTFKIRKDGAWDVSWGMAADTNTAAAATEGVLDGGNNIKAPAGNYRLYVNMNDSGNMTWELNAEDFGK